MAKPLRVAIVHHTVQTNAYSSSEVDDLLRIVLSSHLGRGWCDVAYNLFVDRFGRIWEGRTGGANAPVIGGHSAGFNSHSVGIALLGQHQPGASPAAAAPSPAAIAALQRVIGWKLSLHGIRSTSSTVVESLGSTKYPAGTMVGLANVSGHRDVSLTACPGDLVVSQLTTIRSGASSVQALHPAPFTYGLAADVPLAGDWDGNGRAGPGIRRGRVFHLRNGASAGAANASIDYGLASDIPVTGDWNGDGKDTIGVFRGGAFLLRDINGAGSAHRTIQWGKAGDAPVIGDWDGDGDDDVGFRRGNSWNLLTPSGPVSFHYGVAADSPFAGDWDGDGTPEIGVRRGTAMLLRPSLSSGPATAAFNVGSVAAHPIAADWSGLGVDTVGHVEGRVFRPISNMTAMQ
jgi:hypothetical protein